MGYYYRIKREGRYLRGYPEQRQKGVPKPWFYFLTDDFGGYPDIMEWALSLGCGDPTIGYVDHGDVILPIHAAARSRNSTTFNMLCEDKRTNINTQDKKKVVNDSDDSDSGFGESDNNYTPLHYAVSEHRVENIKILLSYLPHLQQSDHEGNTPLHLAARLKNAKIINLLLDAGADRESVNQEGQTPRDLYAESNDQLDKVTMDRLCERPRVCKFSDTGLFSKAGANCSFCLE